MRIALSAREGPIDIQKKRNHRKDDPLLSRTESRRYRHHRGHHKFLDEKAKYGNRHLQGFAHIGEAGEKRAHQGFSEPRRHPLLQAAKGQSRKRANSSLAFSRRDVELSWNMNIFEGQAQHLTAGA
jgi:hypothetical protein